MNNDLTLKDIYSTIKTPEELLEFMKKNISFGFIGTNKRKYDSSDLDASIYASDVYWTLADSATVLQNGCGSYFDQVELERDWFTKNGYEYKTLYITFLLDKVNSYPTHAYLAYKKDNKWYWFESYDKANQGIHEYNTIEELIGDQMNKHISFTKKFNPLDADTLTKLHIYDYEKPNIGLKRNEILKVITSSSEVPLIMN